MRQMSTLAWRVTPIGTVDEEGRVVGYEGRLELTWTNKRLRLLAHEDGTY